MIDKNFRKEYKLVLSAEEIENFLNMFKSNSKELYKKRTVQSLYMDTKNYDIFHKAQRYDVDKFTLRYRTYSNNNNVYFEVKENISSGKFKTSSLTNFKNLEEVKFLKYKSYHTTPALLVSYVRSYYSFESARITVDRALSFESSLNRNLSTRKHNSYLNILEIKLLDSKNIDVEYLLLKNPQKFSKFQYGLSKIYNLSLN